MRPDGAPAARRTGRANVFGVTEESGEKPDRAPTSERPSGDGCDPRAKETALQRLNDASDDVLAVFEQNLREDATAAGASEQEIRDAQAEHPEHP